MLKRIAKSVFPAALLKKWFLRYNSLKIRTIDRLIFPEHFIDFAKFDIYRNGYPFRESEIDLDDLPTGEVKNFMLDWYNWTQEEFLLQFQGDNFIEPDHGWAVTKGNELIYYSLGVSRTPFQKKPRILKTLIGGKRFVEAEKVISLRDTGEENYFHFFNDLLSKIFFLKQHGISVEHIPIVVSKRAWEKPYFSFFIQSSEYLKSLRWLIQDHQYVRSKTAIFCKPLTHKKDLWDLVISPVKPKTPASGSERIFLTRSRARLRFIENSSEIEDICRSKGFRVIDTDKLEPSAQVQTFAHAAVVVGIHGAGLTNIVFRNAPARLLELFPPPESGYLPYHYIMLAKMYGFRYSALIGEKSSAKYQGSFYVPVEQFEMTLNQLLDQA